MFSYTLWPSLYDLDRHETVTESWSDMVARFTTHTPVVAKVVTPGFSPYTMRPPPTVCYRHKDQVPRSDPHRCDQCVDAVPFLVFDADQGPPDECIERLGDLAQIWYTTYSHSPTKPAYRLILPLAEPVAGDLYPELRLRVLERFAIPADRVACSGKSHFYFLPAVNPRADFARAWATEGRHLNAVGDGLIERARYNVTQPRVAVAAEVPLDFEDRDRLGEYRAALQSRIAVLSRKKDGATRAELLERCLRGAPLAESGSRNTSTLVVCGLMAYALPEASLPALTEILRPSVEAMIAGGSKLTWPKVERMLMSAMRSKAAADQRDREIRNIWKKRLNDLKANIRDGRLD
jgi:hypothetical protein